MVISVFLLDPRNVPNTYSARCPGHWLVIMDHNLIPPNCCILKESQEDRFKTWKGTVNVECWIHICNGTEPGCLLLLVSISGQFYITVSASVVAIRGECVWENRGQSQFLIPVGPGCTWFIEVHWQINRFPKRQSFYWWVHQTIYSSSRQVPLYGGLSVYTDMDTLQYQ